MRLKFPDHVGEGAEGMADTVAALLQQAGRRRRGGRCPRTLSRRISFLRSPRRAIRSRARAVALVVLGADDRVDGLRLVRLAPPVGLSPARALDREHRVAA